VITRVCLRTSASGLRLTTANYCDTYPLRGSSDAMADYEAIKVRKSSCQHHSLPKFFIGAPQLFTRLCTHRTRRAPPIPRAHPPSINLRFGILFLNVRTIPVFSVRVLISHMHGCRLPKDTLPIREAAVASTASVLAGFGVVALFCSVGVYV